MKRKWRAWKAGGGGGLGALRTAAERGERWPCHTFAFFYSEGHMKKKRSERFLESADSKEGAGRNASLCHWSGKAELRQTGAVPASCLRFQLPTPPPLLSLSPENSNSI